MKWARERDLLIAQTMAFVQSVSGKKPAAEVRPDLLIPAELGPAANVDKAMGAITEALEPPRDERSVELPRMVVPSAELRQEIQNRVALFRAHQQRCHKARDQHYMATMAQVRASTQSATGQSPA
jgi:hypothetical protein